MIIDFHAHLKRNRQTREYLVQDLLEDMDQNGVSVRMISAMEGRSIPDQNDTVAGLVREYPDRLIGCAVINPKEDTSVDEAVRAAQMPEIRAFELDSLEHGYLPESWTNIDEIIDVAERHKLVVKLFTGTGFRANPGQWAYYTRRHPGVDFVFLHMGTNDFGYGCIDLVSQYDNLRVETSNQYELPIYKKAFKVLPAEKFLFGSGYPEQITHSSLNVLNVLNLPEEIREKIFYQNAKNLLGF